MPLVNIDTLGRIGVIKDLPSYSIDTAAWNEALNVRAVDGKIQSIGGRSIVMGQPPQAPLFMLAVPTGVEAYWLWTSLRRAYAYDGIAHREVTREAGLYSSQAAQDWNGLVFNGVPIVNNGNDAPQYWAVGSGVTTKLQDLPNWPTNLKAKVVRAIGGNLVALNITSGGVQYQHRLRWSHTADPGSFPSSWDIADPEVDAGEYDLPDVNAGPLMDGLNLRGQLFLYKQGSTWRMRFIGGQYVFSFDSFLETSGVLATRCVGLTPDGSRHFVVTQDDIIVHDGAQTQSVLDGRLRRHIFANMDQTTYPTAFVFSNPRFHEMWFCYPEVGQAAPNKAVVWNSKTGAATFVQVDFVAAATGAISVPSSGTWDSDTNSWNSDTEGWSTIENNRTVVANPTAVRFHKIDSGNTFAGATVPITLQRLGLGIIGKKRDGSPQVDFNRRKMVNRLFPKMTGGPVWVRLAAQDSVDGTVRWSSTVSFNPATQKWVDLIVEGAAIGVEFSSDANVAFEIEGMILDLDVDGEF